MIDEDAQKIATGILVAVIIIMGLLALLQMLPALLPLTPEREVSHSVAPRAPKPAENIYASSRLMERGR